MAWHWKPAIPILRFLFSIVHFSFIISHFPSFHCTSSFYAHSNELSLKAIGLLLSSFMNCNFNQWNNMQAESPPKSIVRTIAIWGVSVSEKHFGAKFNLRVRIGLLNWAKKILNFHLVHTVILDMSAFQWPRSILVTLSGKVKWLDLTYLPWFGARVAQI